MTSPQQIQQLVSDVEELLASLDDEHNPRFDQLRDRVEATISQAKAALKKHSNVTASKLRDYAGMADDYISGYPRTAFASGIVIGAAIGFLVATFSVRPSRSGS